MVDVTLSSISVAHAVSIGRPREQDEVAIGVFDNEILRSPGLLFERLVKLHSGGLKLEKQLFDLGSGAHLDRC